MQENKTKVGVIDNVRLIYSVPLPLCKTLEQDSKNLLNPFFKLKKVEEVST